MPAPPLPSQYPSTLSMQVAEGDDFLRKKPILVFSHSLLPSSQQETCLVGSHFKPQQSVGKKRHGSETCLRSDDIRALADWKPLPSHPSSF